MSQRATQKADADAAMRMALDRESVREKDPEGRLRVARTPISKEGVNPYYGKEIPFSDELGLKPNEVYLLLRPGDELEKGALSSNGVQLLKKHVPIDAKDHKPYDVVGALGTDADYEEPYLYNSLTVWTQDAIDDIESDEKKELSCGYHYRPEMTPGVFNGKRFDGIMRDIVFNHVALVKDGRAGPDVVVGDSMENLMPAKATRLGALALNLTAAHIAPLLALDAKIELPKDLFAGITTKTFKGKKAELLAGVRKSLDGKLRKGLAMDASTEGLAKLLDALEETSEAADESVSEPQHKAMEAAAHGTSTLGIPKNVGQEFSDADKGKSFDAAPFKAFLKEKGMGDEDIDAAMDMLPKNEDDEEAEDEEMDEAEKKKKAEEKAAADKKAMDEKEAAEKKAAEDKAAKDAEMNDRPTKAAMDAAIKSAVKDVRTKERGIREALETVRPYVGELPASMAFDSAEDVLRHTAVMLNIKNAKTLHVDALQPLIEAQPKPGRESERRGDMAFDEAGTDDFNTRFPDAARIGVA